MVRVWIPDSMKMILSAEREASKPGVKLTGFSLDPAFTVLNEHWALTIGGDIDMMAPDLFQRRDLLCVGHRCDASWQVIGYLGASNVVGLKDMAAVGMKSAGIYSESKGGRQ